MADTAHFERDPNAGAHLAAQFGAGAGNAEQMIEANAMRFSEELLAANDLPLDQDATKELQYSDVASAAGVEEKDILDCAVRGPYVTFVAVDPASGRTYKGVLNREGDSLEAPEAGSDPRRARIAAQIEAAKTVEEARREAAQIIRDAEQEAAQKVAEAAQEGQQKAADAAAEAQQQREQEQDESGGRQPGDQGTGTAAQRASSQEGGNEPSQAQRERTRSQARRGQGEGQK